MNYYITSDIGHNKLIDYCSRPSNFSEKIIKNHDNIIKENDILIHLGDICIGNDKLWHERFFENLKCKKWLVKGNHDRNTNTWYISNGWDMICDSLHLNIFGCKILFTHIPVNEEILNCMNIDYNIHGHLHDNDHRKDETNSLTNKHILVKLEHNYSPINVKNLLNKKDSK